MKNYFSLKKIPKCYQVAAAGWISRFFAGLCQIVSISILLDYLGVGLYAIFAIITGLQAWFLLADCGIGPSLQNYISEVRAHNGDDTGFKNNVVIISFVLLLVICGGFICISPWLQHFLFHKINPMLAASQSYLLTSAGVIYIATSIFGISYRVLFASHKGHWAYFYQGIGPVISVISIVAVKHTNISEYRLLIALLSWLLPQLIVSVFSYIQVFSFRNIFKNVNFQIIKAVLIRGMKFWGFTVLGTFALSTDYIIMAQTLTAKDIAIYNILFKMYGVLYFLYTALLMAIWPEVAELFYKREWSAANGIIKKNLLHGSVIVVFFTLLFIVTRHLIITILAPNTNLIIPKSAILFFGCCFLLRIFIDTYAMALQSQNRFKVLWIYMPFQIVISGVGMYFFSLNFGLNGLVCGLILSLLLTSVWIVPREYYKSKIEG